MVGSRRQTTKDLNTEICDGRWFVNIVVEYEALYKGDHFPGEIVQIGQNYFTSC